MTFDEKRENAERLFAAMWQFVQTAPLTESESAMVLAALDVVHAYLLDH